MPLIDHSVYGIGGFDPAKTNNNVIISATLTVDQADINGDALRNKAQTALTNNQAFLAISSPTNAQALAQIQALTRQMDALIRLQLALLADISDT